MASNSSKNEWIAFQWLDTHLRGDYAVPCMQEFLKTLLKKLDDKVSGTLVWGAGSPIATLPSNDFTTFAYSTNSCRMYGDFHSSASYDRKYSNFDDFIHEINKSRASTCLGISDRDIERIENASQTWAQACKPVTYDTVCQHCGAPAQTMFFNVECSKGCMK